MRLSKSFISCCLILVVLLGYRSFYSDIDGDRKPLMITQWDAFGYYQYLPAVYIYHDFTKLDWAAAVDKKYNASGGDGLPVQHLENGNKVGKYLCGVAILEAPFFAIGHFMAKFFRFPQDGFSPPYQYALAFGAILYCFLALLLLRTILLRYFSETTVTITLLFLTLATNFLQYAAIHNGLSHVWIFPLYVFLIYSTIKWHERPKASLALLTGFIIGLATICRPTEAISLFIPLLWGLQSREASRTKWQLVQINRSHIFWVILGGVAGILPQLLYWKLVTGSYIFDVGSKWVFFNPWFRVLTGWEKGWFIYTPVTILFVLGLFFMKKYPFRKAILTYCILNIWIVISWDDWHYGASYSCRALVQSYPAFALPLAAFIEFTISKKWFPIIILVGAYLIGVNLFQTVQYNENILHYDDMNRAYYRRIYLNPHPGPLDMSLLNTDEWLKNEKDFSRSIFLKKDYSISNAQNGEVPTMLLLDTLLPNTRKPSIKWVKVELSLSKVSNPWESKLVGELRMNDSLRRTAIRLNNPIGEKSGQFAFYMKVPDTFSNCHLKLWIDSHQGFSCRQENLLVTLFSK